MFRGPSSGSDGRILFAVKAPEADHVRLVLMRTQTAVPVIYEAAATRGEGDNWSAGFDLIPGDYRYFFIVDGIVSIGGGPGRIVQDDFGGTTGLLTVRQTPEGSLQAF